MAGFHPRNIRDRVPELVANGRRSKSLEHNPTLLFTSQFKLPEKNITIVTHCLLNQQRVYNLITSKDITSHW